MKTIKIVTLMFGALLALICLELDFLDESNEISSVIDSGSTKTFSCYRNSDLIYVHVNDSASVFPRDWFSIDLKNQIVYLCEPPMYFLGLRFYSSLFSSSCYGRGGMPVNPDSEAKIGSWNTLFLGDRVVLTLAHHNELSYTFVMAGGVSP